MRFFVVRSEPLVKAVSTAAGASIHHQRGRRRELPALAPAQGAARVLGEAARGGRAGALLLRAARRQKDQRAVGGDGGAAQTYFVHAVNLAVISSRVS